MTSPESQLYNQEQLPNSISSRGQLAGTKSQHIWYSSNPFLAIVQGTVIALLENPIPVLITPLAWLVVAVALAFVPTFILADMEGLAVRIGIGLWLLAQISSIALLLSIQFQLLISSFHQRRLTTPQAFGRVSNRPFSFVQLCLIVLGPLIAALYLIARGTNIIHVALGGILLIFGFFVIARFGLSLFLFFDKSEDIPLSLQDSRMLTKGHTLEMLAVFTAQLPLCVVGLLSPLIGVAGFATRYFQIRYLKSHQTAPPKVHWSNYALVGILALSCGYLLQVNVSRVQTANREICYEEYIQTGDFYAPAVEVNEVCLTITECKEHPVCSIRLENGEFGDVDY